jgi:hypothetical protein
MAPQRLQVTDLSKRHNPIPNGNQMIAARIPAQQTRISTDTEGGQRKRGTKLTEETILGLFDVRTPLQAHHLRMIRGQERRDVVAADRVEVMVHPRLGHNRDARSRHGVGIEGWGLAGLMQLVGRYRFSTSGRELLIQMLLWDSSDAFRDKKRRKSEKHPSLADTRLTPRKWEGEGGTLTIYFLDCNLVSGGSVSVRSLLGSRSVILLLSQR